MLVSSPSSHGMEFWDEVWIVDMKFIERDANDRAVFLVHCFDAEDVLPSHNSIVVEFVSE